MTMGYDNRFLTTARRRTSYGHRPTPSWVVPQAATSRELVVLLENGGIDLNLRPFIDGVVDLLPGSSLVSDDIRGSVAARLREWLKGVTDDLLESAELTLNRYQAAAPATYGAVHVLRNSTATYAELRDKLFAATRAGHVVDVLVLTHGDSGYIAAGSGIDAAKIRGLRTELGGPLNIRTVYMMSCVGASLNQAWLDAGARASAGTVRNNNLPEPATHLFWTAWKGGTSFETAVTSAYRRTIEMLNDAVRSIAQAVLPGGSLIAPAIDVSGLDVIAASRPEVAGDGSLTVSTDALPAAPAASGMSLVTTVLPTRAMSALRPVATAYSLSTGRRLSPQGKTFVEGWERPLAPRDAEGEAELARRIAAAEHLVAEQIPVALTQPQIDALVSFACGIGRRAFLASTAYRLLGEGRLDQVPAEIARWTKVRRNGVLVDSAALQVRRRAEAELFTGPVPAVTVPASREVRDYSYQQNPAAAIGLVEAVEWGLAAGSIAQAQYQAERGNLSLSFDKADRLLDPPARLAMPGAPAARRTYTRRFLSFPQLYVGNANAELVVEWGGNAYGEIETPVFKKAQGESSDWTVSELSVTVSLMGRIPSGTDPRAWPFTYRYAGTYDPVDNGKFEFEGEIELNAFGGIRWVRPHQVVSRSFADWMLPAAPEEIVRRGPDVAVATPPIPADQQAYLNTRLPAGAGR
ncbi:MAG: hypothetical protein LT071_10210 [Nocardioides sp.]|nr:hypothetical protein [Nocardioides sp.]